MFYRAFRAALALLIRLFFVMEAPVDPRGALSAEGSVIFVGNHPNGLVDPALVFTLARRKVTFLAKAPLFSMPVLGWILKGLDSLPVFRKQDGADTAKNDGVLSATVDALVQGRAVSLFPEGKSHSEPQLAELKTGCARIALDAAAKGAAVRIVPIGLTYAEKNRFRSRVHVEVGAPVEVKDYVDAGGAESRESVKRLTEAIADALKAVTLNLDSWEDLPIIETAEALYALEQGDRAGDEDRKRAFARGLSLLREEQPERFERLKSQVAAYRRRLELVRVQTQDVATPYRPAGVAWFVVRNLMWLFGLPVFAVGMAVFFVPYWIPLLMVRVAKPSDDTESTIKVLTLMLLGPFWWAVLVGFGWWWAGLAGAVVALVGTLPLALFTRYFLERRMAALRDVRVFFLLLSQSALKARLVEEGRALAAEVTAVAEELKPRVVAAEAGPQAG